MQFSVFLIALAFWVAPALAFFRGARPASLISRKAVYEVELIDKDTKLPYRTVRVDSEHSILASLLVEPDLDAPFGCQAGLCTDCAALVVSGTAYELDAAVLDEETTAKGFILTCSSRVTGPGLKLLLGVGEDMYESQYGDFRKDHESYQTGDKKTSALDVALNLNVEA